MRAEDIRYIYLGARAGIISPQALRNSEFFEIRYQRDGTWVFEALEYTP